MHINRRSFFQSAGAAGIAAALGRVDTASGKNAFATNDGKLGNPATVTSGFVQNAGADIYYEHIGSGPAVLFAHGLSGNHLSWWQQVPYFSERYACITFAHRGFSPSRTTAGRVDPSLFEDDLLALMDHLKVGEVRLIAQSMGGRGCLNVALHHPQRVRAVVMASTAGAVDLKSLGEADRKSLENWFAVNGGMEAELRKDGVHPAAGERMAREQPALEFLYREIDRLSSDLDKDALRPKLEATRTLPSSDLTTLKVPTLFISGTEDVVFPPPAAAALAKLVPGGKLESIPETGHSAYFQRPEIFNRLVFDFFERQQNHAK
jgi:3-oxoadipate enol-lactonase